MNARRDVSIVVAAALLLAAAMAGSTPAPTADATTERAKGGRLIVSPRAGQVVRTDGVRIRVRGGRVLRARLNGVGIARGDGGQDADDHDDDEQLDQSESRVFLAHRKSPLRIKESKRLRI